MRKVSEKIQLRYANDTIAQKKDSLLFQVTYLKKDSLERMSHLMIQSSLIFAKKRQTMPGKENRNRAKIVVKEYLKINYLAQENKIDLNKNLTLESQLL